MTDLHTRRAAGSSQSSGLGSRQVRSEGHFSLRKPACDFPNSTGHQLEERSLVTLARSRSRRIQHPGHLVKVVPRLINDRGSAGKERQRRGEDCRRVEVLGLRL